MTSHNLCVERDKTISLIMHSKLIKEMHASLSLCQDEEEDSFNKLGAPKPMIIALMA